MAMLKATGRILAFCGVIAAPGLAAAQAAGPPVPVPPPAGPSGIAPIGILTPPAAAPGVNAAPNADAAEEYVLGPEDVVEIEVVGTNDRTRARIYTDGTIQTNFGGRVAAAGRTPRQLASEMVGYLKTGGFYSNPVVNVEVVGYSSRYVTVLGAVTNPGLIPINRPYRLSEIVARVGGVRGDGASYLIVRSENGPEKRYFVDKLAAGSSADDPMVAPGDKIFSPPAEIFYINGQVRSPGSFPMRTETVTVAQAIAMSGGLSESGSDKKVKVRRGNTNLKLRPADKVEAGDVLTVGERLF